MAEISLVGDTFLMAKKSYFKAPTGTSRLASFSNDYVALVNTVDDKTEILDFYRRNSEKNENYIWWSYQKPSSSFVSRGVNVYNKGFIYVPKDSSTDYYSYTTSNLIWILDKTLAEEDLANLFITFNNNIPGE